MTAGLAAKAAAGNCGGGSPQRSSPPHGQGCRRHRIVSPAVPDRMNREQFFDRLAGLGRQQLIKVLWALYWRGSAALRQRIEAELHTAEHGTRPQPAATPPVDPILVRAEVEQFVALARAGAYLGGDRRISPRERTRWRFTFQRLAADGQRALREPEPVNGVAAVEQLIDLACEMGGYDYFRSEDPVEAARFVVSDAVALLWATLRERGGFAEFAKRAAAQLIRWETVYGWTRTGDGRVAKRETSLAGVLADMLRVPDAWVGFADAYLDALDDTAHAQARTGRNREQRTEALAKWNLLLVDHLAGTDAEDRLDRLIHHPALNGPEQQHLQARLAHRRGDLAGARHLMQQCLQRLPGHSGFVQFATEINTSLPVRA
jgi:hypothetical protein